MLVMVKESSDESATIKKDSGSSQEPLIKKIGNKTRSDEKIEKVHNFKQVSMKNNQL